MLSTGKRTNRTHLGLMKRWASGLGAENNITALQSELYFYGRILGIEPAKELPTVEIDNLNP